MKVYQKPEIRFESFTMSENVAATCSLIDRDGKLEFSNGLTLISSDMGCDFHEGEELCLTNAYDVVGDQQTNSF